MTPQEHWEAAEHLLEDVGNRFASNRYQKDSIGSKIRAAKVHVMMADLGRGNPSLWRRSVTDATVVIQDTELPR